MIHKTDNDSIPLQNFILEMQNPTGPQHSLLTEIRNVKGSSDEPAPQARPALDAPATKEARPTLDEDPGLQPQPTVENEHHAIVHRTDSHSIALPVTHSLTSRGSFHFDEPKKYKIFGAEVQIDILIKFIMLFLLEIGICFAYGFGTHFKYEDITFKYPMLQDVNVMILFGFGFLMSYLKYYSWSSVSFSMFIAVLCLQIYPLMSHFWAAVLKHEWHEGVPYNITVIIGSLYCGGSCLISYGGVIGLVSSAQIIVLVAFNITGYTLAEKLIFDVLLVEDIGGSMGIHLFGASFGIACAIGCLWKTTNPKMHRKNTSGYLSNLFSFAGSAFLFMYWPSFNAAYAINDEERIRAICNTFLALSASAIATFMLSSTFNENKYNMEEILNATLAGGVIIGASCNLIGNMAWAIGFGLVGGVVCFFGFKYFASFQHKHLRLYDTVGITNLHFLPGLLGSLGSAFICAIYYNRETRSASKQGGIQVACTFICLGIGAGSGLFAGLVMRLLPRPHLPFTDKGYWLHIESTELE